MENKVTDLQNSIYDLKKKVDLFIHQLLNPQKQADEKQNIEVSSPVHLGVAASAGTSGKIVHGNDHQHQSVGAGVVTILVPPPVTGARHPQNLSPVPFIGFGSKFATPGSFRATFGNDVPHLEFPRFDNTNPKIWVKRCETYFDVYEVLEFYRVKLATMNFTGSVDFWMQSIEMDVKILCWDDLCQSTIDRFE